MAIQIVHAKMDENGKTDGPKVGDNTTKEIVVTSFYLNDSVFLLTCKDARMASGAADVAVQIARDDNYGYSQKTRLTGYNAIKANGGIVNGGKGSFDCATLIAASYKLNGLDIPVDLYTGNLVQKFEATGMFTVRKGSPYADSSDYAEVGALDVRPKTSARGGHVFMALDAGRLAGKMSGGESEADNIDPPYVLSKGRVNVRATAGSGGKIIYTASNGEKLPFGESDNDTGWYGVDTPNGPGFISNKPKYTKLVTS